MFQTTKEDQSTDRMQARCSTLANSMIQSLLQKFEARTCALDTKDWDLPRVPSMLQAMP